MFNGRRTTCATDNSMRELYHGRLGDAVASDRTGLEVAQILPRTAVLLTLMSGKGDRKTRSCPMQQVANRSTDKVGRRSNICSKKRESICHSVKRGLERERLSAITFCRDGMCLASRQVCQARQMWRISHERRQRSRDRVPPFLSKITPQRSEVAKKGYSA